VSEPPLRCRNESTWRQNRGPFSLPGRVWKEPVYCPDGVRHEGGVTLLQAFTRNVGTCRPGVKGEIQVGSPHEDESTETGHRGGAACSRREGSVMELDRRGCIIWLYCEVNQRWEEPRG
jgi:hypothetical protein